MRLRNGIFTYCKARRIIRIFEVQERAYYQEIKTKVPVDSRPIE